MNKVVLVILLSFIIPLTHFSHIFLNDKHNKEIPIESIRFNLPSPDITKTVSFGYQNLIADILWLRFIQYVGSFYINENKYLPDLYSFLDNITTLDPNFKDAYSIGAYSLSENKEFDKAISLLDKGIKNVDDWYIPYQAGFLYYIKKKNKKMAIVYFEKARKYKENQELMIRLIASLKLQTDSDDYDVQIELWKAVYESSKKIKDYYNIDKAEKKIIEITIKKDLKNIQKDIDKYNKESDKNDNTVYPDGFSDKDKKETIKQKKLEEWKDLVDAKIVTQIPLDPFKRPYIFDTKKQKVYSFPIPWEKKK